MATSAAKSLPRGLSPDARVVMGEALNAGWTYTVTARGHLRLLHPDGVHTAQLGPKATKRNRAIQNVLATIRRYPVAQPQPTPTPDVSQDDTQPALAAAPTDPTTENTPQEATSGPQEPEEEHPAMTPQTATAQPAQEALEPAQVTRPDGTPYTWIRAAGGRYVCTSPGCGWSRRFHADMGDKRGLHLHEARHETDATHRTAIAASGGNRSAQVRADRKAAAQANLANLADYLGMRIGNPKAEAQVVALEAKVTALTAERDDLKARLALIKDAWSA